MVRCGVTRVFGVVCSVCIVSKQVAGGLLMSIGGVIRAGA